MTEENSIPSVYDTLQKLSVEWNQLSNPCKTGEVLKLFSDRIKVQREKDRAIALSNYKKYKRNNPKSGEEYRCVGCIYLHRDNSTCMNNHSPNYDVSNEIKLDCGGCFQRKETRCSKCKHIYADFYTGNEMCGNRENWKNDRDNGIWIWAHSRYCGNCFTPKRKEK